VLEPETARYRAQRPARSEDLAGRFFFHLKDDHLMQTMLANLKRAKKHMILPDRRSG
jgi:hypothetical protein